VPIGDVAENDKCTADVFAAFLPGQTGLRRGLADFDAQHGINRRFDGWRHGAGEFQRLVEPALTQPLWRQRHRHNQVGLRRFTPAEHLGQRADGGQPAAVFARLNQTVDGETVTRGGKHAIEMRRLGKTAAADAWCGQWVGAAQAPGSREPGQLGPARLAQAAYRRAFLAKQAVRGEDCPGRDPPFVK